MQVLGLVRIFKNTKSTVSKTEDVLDGTRVKIYSFNHHAIFYIASCFESPNVIIPDFQFFSGSNFNSQFLSSILYTIPPIPKFTIKTKFIRMK